MPATAEEIALVVNDNGGGLSIHLGAGGKEVHFLIEPVPTGTIDWEFANAADVRNVTEEEFAAATPDDICSLAAAYDDKLGLRLFAGGADGATFCQ